MISRLYAFEVPRALLDVQASSNVCQRCRRRILSQVTRNRILIKPLRAQYLQIRLASNSQRTYSNTRSVIPRLKKLFLGTAISVALIFGYVYFTDTRSSFLNLQPSILRLIYPDAEDSHHAGNYLLKVLYEFGLHPRERGNDGKGDLAISVCPSLFPRRDIETNYHALIGSRPRFHQSLCYFRRPRQEW